MKKVILLLLAASVILLFMVGYEKSDDEVPRLKESQVSKIADAYAEKEGYDMKEFLESAVKYDEKTQEWHVFYGQVPARDKETGKLFFAPGKHFYIYVDDKTGIAVRLTPRG
jgi:cation diffusion facilitator CzcD-associated flavoprotein CzcO